MFECTWMCADRSFTGLIASGVMFLILSCQSRRGVAGVTHDRLPF